MAFRLCLRVALLCCLPVVRPWLRRWFGLACASRGSNFDLTLQRAALSPCMRFQSSQNFTQELCGYSRAASCSSCKFGALHDGRLTSSPSRARCRAAVAPHQERSGRVVCVSGTAGALRRAGLAAVLRSLSIPPQIATDGWRGPGQPRTGARTAPRDSSMQECA